MVSRVLPTDMTFEKGFYPTINDPTFMQMQMSYRSLLLGGAGAGVRVDARTVFSIFGSGGSNTTITNPLSPFPVNQPVIMTITLAGTTGKVYVNGSLVASGTISSSRSRYKEPYWWGNCNYTMYSTTDHRVYALTEEKIQYIRYYADKALSDAEVLQNYNANKARLGLT